MCSSIAGLMEFIIPSLHFPRLFIEIFGAKLDNFNQRYFHVCSVHDIAPINIDTNHAMPDTMLIKTPGIEIAEIRMQIDTQTGSCPYLPTFNSFFTLEEMNIKHPTIIAMYATINKSSIISFFLKVFELVIKFVTGFMPFQRIPLCILHSFVQLLEMG